MPHEDFIQTRAALAEVDSRVARLEVTIEDGFRDYAAAMRLRDENLHRRTRIFTGIAAVLTTAVLLLAGAQFWAGAGVRANTAEIKKNEQNRIENCRAGRHDLQVQAKAIADILVDLAKKAPQNQAPEDQTRLESYRPFVRASLVASAPDPDQCA